MNDEMFIAILMPSFHLVTLVTSVNINHFKSKNLTLTIIRYKLHL